MKRDTIDIIIPVYRPAPGWFPRLAGYMDKLYNNLPEHTSIKIILVNDSPDKWEANQFAMPGAITYEIVDYRENKGKGYAIRKGLERSAGDLIIFTDHDIPYGWPIMLSMIQILHSGADVVLPVRTPSYYQSLSRRRRWISKALVKANQLLLGLAHPDTQAGLKGLNGNHKEVLLSGRENGFLFEVEWIRKAEKREKKIVTIPAELDTDQPLSEISNTALLHLATSYIKLFFRH